MNIDPDENTTPPPPPSDPVFTIEGAFNERSIPNTMEVPDYRPNELPAPPEPKED